MKVKNSVSQNIKIFPKINQKKDLQNRKVPSSLKYVHLLGPYEIPNSVLFFHKFHFFFF